MDTKISALTAATAAAGANEIPINEAGVNKKITVAQIATKVLTPVANFVLTQNSVAALTSEETGAIVNTLYLKTGNVGIGTIAPAEKLVVFENGTRGVVQIGGYGAVGTIYSAGDVVLGKNVKPTEGAVSGMQYMVTGTAGGTAIRMGATSGIQFHILAGSVTAGDAFTSEVMRITSAGNVGIGTTAPGAKLDLPASTATAGTASLKINAGVGLTVPVAGCMFFDGTDLFIDV